jgi:cold shock CspA family protein
MKAEGTAKYWNRDKLFGFVRPDTGGEGGDLFVHQSQTLDDLQQGDRVKFNSQPSRKKIGAFEAADVEVIE